MKDRVFASRLSVDVLETLCIEPEALNRVALKRVQLFPDAAPADTLKVSYWKGTQVLLGVFGADQGELVLFKRGIEKIKELPCLFLGFLPAGLIEAADKGETDGPSHVALRIGPGDHAQVIRHAAITNLNERAYELDLSPYEVSRILAQGIAKCREAHEVLKLKREGPSVLAFEVKQRMLLSSLRTRHTPECPPVRSDRSA